MRRPIGAVVQGALLAVVSSVGATSAFVSSIEWLTELEAKNSSAMSFVAGVHDVLNGVVFCVPNETIAVKISCRPCCVGRRVESMAGTLVLD